MKKLTFTTLMLFLLAALISGCSAASTPQPTQASASAAPTQVAALPTATTEASPTPQATKILLIAPPGTDPQSAQAALADLGGKTGLSVETRADLQKADLTPDVKLAVLLSPLANLAELLSAAPQTQFVVVSGVDLQPGANLTVIREKPENQAFLAGFISVLLSTDYRSAGLLPSDGPLGAGLKDAFVNGGHYYCGVCAPGWPLRVYYPVFAEQPSSADGPTWQAAAAGLFDTQKVEVYYLPPQSIHPEVISYLQGKTQADHTLVLLGNAAPPEELKSQWAASVSFDVSSVLTQVWPDITTGKSAGVQEAPLQVDHINADLLGEGRMRLVKILIEDLKSGKVTPMTVPPQ